MKQKTFAVIGDVVLVVLAVGGAAWLLAIGGPTTVWSTDKSLLPLSADWSRALLLLTAGGVVLGLVLGGLTRRGADRVLDGEVVRYSRYDRLVHLGLAVGYLLAFGTAVLLLRWFDLGTDVATRPLTYLVHFVGAALIVFAGATFVASTRVQGKDALFPRWRDVSPALARLFGYLGIYGEPGVLGLRWPRGWQRPTQRVLAGLGIRPFDREDKFLSVEKVLSFTPLAVLTLLVVATGLAKAAKYFFAVPPDVLYWSTWLHDLSTQLTVVVLGAHLAAIFLVPRNWPGIRAMVTGRMSRKLVAHEFPAWAERLARPEGARPGAEAAPAPGTVH